MITHHKDYTDTLKTGNHTITMTFTNGKATAEFNIVENKEAVIPPDPTTPVHSKPATPKSTQSVITRDNSQVAQYIALLAIVAYTYKKYYHHNKS